MSKKLIVAVVAVWALVLAGGVGIAVVALTRGDDAPKPGADDTSSSPSASTQGADGRTIDDFYRQKLTWSDCGANECAELEVPIDYQKPGDGSIKIAVERAKATGTRVGSLVVNPGGPGAPGTSTVRDAQYYFAGELRAAYDIVGFDPRGTGKSAPVDCLSDSALDAYVAADPDPDTPEEVAENEKSSEEFWAGCKARSGTLAAHVSTVEAARDMDVLRAALGEKKLDYLGFSYGTRLGATYAELYPENTGRLVLDGAIDPSLSARQGALSQAAGFETALRAYAADCLAANDCPLSGTVDQALQQIRGVVEQVDARPMSTDGRWLQAGNAFYGLLTPLYSRDTWPMLTSALRAVIEEKNGSQLLLLADAYASRVGGTYLDNSAEAIMAINCLDDPWALTPEQVPAQMAAFTKASPTFGDAFAWSMTGCLGWQQQAGAKAADGERVDAAGAPPIVVVGTTRDPATPYAWSQRLARDLASGVLVTRDGDGHTGLNAGNDCVDTAVADYLVDGTVPADGLTC